MDTEIQAFIKYFYAEQVENGDFESIPYSDRKYDFITHSNVSGSMSLEYFLRKSKSLTHTDNFYDLSKTLNKLNELINQTDKSIRIKNGYEQRTKYYTLNTFKESLDIFTKITSDEYFSIYNYVLSSSNYLGISTFTGYSILFDTDRILQEEDHIVVDLYDILVRYIDEKFRYLKDWHIHQLHRYCRKIGIVAPLRKIEVIKTIQDSEPTNKPSLVFLDQLIKRPEIFREIILHFLDSEEIDWFGHRCIRALYLSGRKNVKSILNETINLSGEEKIDFLFSSMTEYWSKDNDFTALYLNFPKKEGEIKEYVKELYSSLFDVIFPHYLKEQYKLVPPEAMLPKSPIKFKKIFKKFKQTIDILGYQGEQFIYEMLQEENENNPHIIIIWDNQLEESSKPYDILLKVDDVEHFVEVKTSINDIPSFTMSERELNFALQHEEHYTLYHIINFNSNKMAYRVYKNLQKLMEEGKIETLNRTLKGNL